MFIVAGGWIGVSGEGQAQKWSNPQWPDVVVVYIVREGLKVVNSCIESLTPSIDP